MGRKKLLKKLKEYFDMDARSRMQQKDEMNQLLSRLKQKENDLKEEFEQEIDKKKKRVLAQKIDVVHSQRKKGVQMLIDLRNETEQ